MNQEDRDEILKNAKKEYTPAEARDWLSKNHFLPIPIQKTVYQALIAAAQKNPVEQIRQLCECATVTFFINNLGQCCVIVTPYNGEKHQYNSDYGFEDAMVKAVRALQ